MRLETHVLTTAVCKSSRIRYSPNSGTVRRFPVLPTPCAKTAKSCAFCDSLPVFALVCVFAFDTGGLGLWLGAFGKLGLYRCQSVPGPPMPCFVAQSFGFAAFKKAGKFYFGGAGVGVADKPRNVLCSFYVVLTGVWGWLGSQGEPRLCFFFHLFYMLPLQ